MMDKQMMLKSRKQKKSEDAAKGCALVIAIPAVLFSLALMFDDVANSISTQTQLESEYTEFFENPCIKPWKKTLVREWGEDWINQVKQTIMGQAKGHELLSQRKEIYDAHMEDCERLKKSGVVQNMAEVNKMRSTQWEFEYTNFFAKHCVEARPLSDAFDLSVFDHDTQMTILRRLLPEYGGEEWMNYIKKKMIDMMKRKTYQDGYSLEDRKKVYKIYRDNCAVTLIQGDLIEIE